MFIFCFIRNFTLSNQDVHFVENTHVIWSSFCPLRFSFHSEYVYNIVQHLKLSLHHMASSYAMLYTTNRKIYMWSWVNLLRPVQYSEPHQDKSILRSTVMHNPDLHVHWWFVVAGNRSTVHLNLSESMHIWPLPLRNSAITQW